MANFRSTAPHISGVSSINHNLRVKLRLNCSEYAMMDYIYSCEKAEKKADASHCFVRLGFVAKEQQHILGSLVAKGFIEPPAGGTIEFVMTGKWIDAMPNTEKEFEEFWTIYDSDKKERRVCWPGAKPQAKKLFTGVRKVHPFEYLMAKRDEYFVLLETCRKYSFPRQKMMATVFLGPDQRFLEDWKQEKEEFEKLHGKEQEKKESPKAVTMNQIKELYAEKNLHQ